MPERCHLYLITPVKLEPKSFAERLKPALDAGDFFSLQLRLKDVSGDDIRRAVEALMPIAQRAGAAFILNDRPDLAAELRCDGVHVCQDHAGYDDGRAIVWRHNNA